LRWKLIHESPQPLQPIFRLCDRQCFPSRLPVPHLTGFFEQLSFPRNVRILLSSPTSRVRHDARKATYWSQQIGAVLFIRDRRMSHSVRLAVAELRVRRRRASLPSGVAVQSLSGSIYNDERMLCQPTDRIQSCWSRPYRKRRASIFSLAA